MYKKLLLLLVGMSIILPSGGCDSNDKSGSDTNTQVAKGEPGFPSLGYYWVVDTTELLSKTTVSQADAVCQKLKEDGIAEVVVVVINGVKHPEDWSTHYGRWLKLGKTGRASQGGDNGLIWLIRPDSQNKLTVSVGRGLPKFTSVDYGQIMTDTADYFNFGNFNAGVLELIRQTDQSLRRIYGQ